MGLRRIRMGLRQIGMRRRGMGRIGMGRMRMGRMGGRIMIQVFWLIMIQLKGETIYIIKYMHLKRQVDSGF